MSDEREPIDDVIRKLMREVNANGPECDFPFVTNKPTLRALVAEVERRRKALLHYGTHLDRCALNAATKGLCDCGWGDWCEELIR